MIIRHSRPTSHLFGAMFPDKAHWDLPTVLAGRTVDYLALLLWTKTKEARHGRGRPKSVIPEDKPASKRPKVKPTPLSEVKRRLDALHARRKPGPQHLDARTRAEKLRDIFKD